MNVLGMGPMELMLIVVLALIVFGPAKLPEIAGQIGRAIGDFRRATSELSDEFNRTIQAELKETREIVEETRTVMEETRSAVKEAQSAVGEASTAVTTLPAPALVAAPPPPVTTPEPPAANGTGSEPHEQTDTASVNGTLDPKPPLADTSQWSWETAPPPPTPTDAPAADAAKRVADTSMAAENGSTPAQVARDELLPPY